MNSVLIWFHIAIIAGLALYGFLGFFTLWLFLRHKDDQLPLPPVKMDQWPVVTVQLPIYNEREVVHRLIAAAAALDYPHDRLEIQVVDDSTDETTELAAEAVKQISSTEPKITLLHRDNRHGFKAGALQAALASARGDFIAIFDADFVPSPDFLKRTIPYLIADDSLGLVQARWGHLNDGNSQLTGAQAVALDKHFAVEQLVRHRAELFPKFNGAAGVWRKASILDAGGWQSDTVCEDLCLSTRAILGGWRSHYAHDVVTPAELPTTILAYKTQQARWSMGATQCLVKYTRPIWHDRQISIAARLYALLSMSAYATNPLLLLLLLIQLPLLLTDARPPEWLYIFAILGLGQPILFVLGQMTLYNDWRSRLRRVPALLLLAIGIAPSNSHAVAHALLGREFTFSRTPKGAGMSYRLRPDRMLAVEIAFLFYSAVTLIMAITLGRAGPILLLCSALLGFIYVVILSLRER